MQGDHTDAPLGAQRQQPGGVRHQQQFTRFKTWRGQVERLLWEGVWPAQIEAELA